MAGPRDFRYVNNGLEATLWVDNSKGTAVFTNGRTARVGAAALSERSSSRGVVPRGVPPQ